MSVFFRLLLLIPHAIVAYLVIIAVFFSALATWFAIVITGRYPEGLYTFNANAVRWLARYSAYAYLQVDKYPPFGFEDYPEYPLRMHFAGPLPQYSRLKAFFRVILGIPVAIIAYVLSIVLSFCTVAAWFVAVIVGKMPQGLHEALDFCLAYITKAYAYFLLLTETYPPFSNANPTLRPVGAHGVLAARPRGFAPPAAPAERQGGVEGPGAYPGRARAQRPRTPVAVPRAGERCPKENSKRIFATRADAQAFVESSQRRHANPHPSLKYDTPLDHEYECPYYDHWHVSSTPSY